MVTASGRLVARISFRLGRQVFFQPSRSGLFLGLVLEYYALKERKETKKKKEEGIFFIHLTKAVGRNAELLSSTNLVLCRIFRTEGKFYNLNQNLQSSSLSPKTSQICLTKIKTNIFWLPGYAKKLQNVGY